MKKTKTKQIEITKTASIISVIVLWVTVLAFVIDWDPLIENGIFNTISKILYGE